LYEDLEVLHVTLAWFDQNCTLQLILWPNPNIDQRFVSHKIVAVNLWQAFVDSPAKMKLELAFSYIDWAIDWATSSHSQIVIDPKRTSDALDLLKRSTAAAINSRRIEYFGSVFIFVLERMHHIRGLADIVYSYVTRNS
jgi:hypothetical protein